MLIKFDEILEFLSLTKKLMRPHQGVSIAWILLTHYSSLSVNHLDGIQCPYKTDKCKVLRIWQPWCVHVLQRTSLMNSSLFFQHFLLILFGGFAKWELSNCTAAVLLSVTSIIYLKEHTALLCCCHLTFSPIVSWSLTGAAVKPWNVLYWT